MKFPVLLRVTPACLLGLSLLRAAPVRKGAVVAELVPAVAGVQPGHPFEVALRLAHDPDWHSYWVYSGTGYPRPSNGRCRPAGRPATSSGPCRTS